MTSAITIDRLSKRYGDVQALDGVSLEVPAGSIFGFLGPNGAGKTTAIKILAGLTTATSGTTAIAGVPFGEFAYKRAIGYLGQEPRFYDWMTGRETLRYVAGFYPDLGGSVDARIDEVLALTGIADAANRRTRTYSGGMRQRLGIAQALVGQPRVLLLDEPVSALDPIGRRDVLDLMADLRGHATIFYSTHILDDVQRVSDHVAILDQGSLVRAAPTQELLRAFTKGRLRVVFGGAGEETQSGLASLQGVESVQRESTSDDRSTYLVQTRDGATAAVQWAITRFAGDSELTLVSNEPERLDLEEVFLRLIDKKERAA